MRGRNTLADDASSDRNKLVIDIVDTGFLNFFADLFD